MASKKRRPPISKRPAAKLTKINNPAKGIKGIRVGGEPKSELEHFYKCPACGQSVDMRDLGQVFHHEQPGHEPITSDA
jgi:hypothetical protein